LVRGSRYLSAVTVAALAAPLAACGSHRAALDARGAQRAVGYRLYWVGERFEGLPLTAIARRFGSTTFVYGTCKPKGDDGGCSPPLEVSLTSICDRNALVLDRRPRARLEARGVPVLDYGEWQYELGTGGSQVVVFAPHDRALRAIEALRAVDEKRAAGDLAAPRYPLSYLAQLRRVMDAYARTGSVRAVRDELGISKSAVRFQLALGRELGAARLRQAAHIGGACVLEPAR
jgi:hypothetical protein